METKYLALTPGLPFEIFTKYLRIREFFDLLIELFATPASIQPRLMMMALAQNWGVVKLRISMKDFQSSTLPQRSTIFFSNPQLSVQEGSKPPTEMLAPVKYPEFASILSLEASEFYGISALLHCQENKF